MTQRDTRYLTQNNVSLRLSDTLDGMFIVDLHDNPYYADRRIPGVGAFMPNYDGGYTVYDWRTGVDNVNERVATLNDAIYTLLQHFGLYTF